MRWIKRVVRISVLSGALFCLATGLLLASPLGRLVDQGLTAHFAAMNQRREQQQLTWWDGIQCQLLYTGIAGGGRLFFPEGGEIIWHYLHGHGSDLWLSPDYIRASPVILRSLAQLKEGESRQFRFRQAEDWRLSYAVNPFSLKKTSGNVLLWQLMKFETGAETFTTLNYGIGQFQLPDALIYSMHPETYTVYCKWKL